MFTDECAPKNVLCLHYVGLLCGAGGGGGGYAALLLYIDKFLMLARSICVMRE